MAKWWGRGTTRKYQVKLNKVRLEVEDLSKIEERERVITIQIVWEGTPPPPIANLGFASFSLKSHQPQSSVFKQEMKSLKLVQESSIDEGNNDIEFDHICTFSINSKDPNSFDPWFVSFNILSGKSEQTTSLPLRTEMQVIGKTVLNLGELASKMEAQIEQKIPITLQLEGVTLKASLKVVVSLTEMRNNSDSLTKSRDSLRNVQNSGDSEKFLRRAKSQVCSITQEKAKKRSIKLFGKQLSLRNSNESSAGLNSVSELPSRPSSDSQLELAKEGWFRKWKRRKFKKKIEVNDSILDKAGKISNLDSWEVKELVSRDKKTKLKASVFFASYDQRDEKAAGESACAAIVAIIAHWLHLNPGKMPTSFELDRLITEGSSEWRKLCEDHTHRDFFPDRHFDLETILGAELRPLVVLQNDSRIGFFHPERFEHLRGAQSFDDIWREIDDQTNKNVPRVYIVRWNDHFFVLKMEANVNYIVDSLGERLHEGCTQAYILRFDDSAVMYEEGEGKLVICQGKECCREYMKRFLAAITLREFKEAEEEGRTVEVAALYQRLQIDFHLSSPSSSADVSTASTSISASPNTSPDFPCK